MSIVSLLRGAPFWGPELLMGARRQAPKNTSESRRTWGKRRLRATGRFLRKVSSELPLNALGIRLRFPGNARFRFHQYYTRIN